MAEGKRYTENRRICSRSRPDLQRREAREEGKQGGRERSRELPEFVAVSARGERGCCGARVSSFGEAFSFRANSFQLDKAIGMGLLPWT